MSSQQNPENYAVKKGIPRDRIEKHMQGLVLSLSNHQFLEICVCARICVYVCVKVFLFTY